MIRRKFVSDGFCCSVLAVAVAVIAGPAIAQNKTDSASAAAGSTDTTIAQAAAPAPAAAASNAGATAGEIVVTARSGRESLISVPVAVTAISARDLARYNSSDLIKISQIAPQVQIYSGGAGAGGTFIVRGIGTSGDDAGLDQSVAINIDGVQVLRPRTVFLGQFDTQQVEVLKGPQALFFGKNSPAGVISLKTANPTDHFEGYVKGGYEFKAHERYVEAAAGGPVTDTLGIRIAGRYSKMRGYVENISTDRPDPFNPSVIIPGTTSRWGPQAEQWGVRGTIVWKPTSNYTSNLKISAGGYTDNDPLATAESVCSPGSGPPTTLGITDPVSDCSLNGVKAASNLPPLYVAGAFFNPRWHSGVPYTKISSQFLSWQQSLDLGDVTINSTTGYSHLKYSARGNYNQMEAASFAGGTDEYYHGFSEELRAITNFDGPLNFTIGGYYERTRNRQHSALFLYNLGPDATTGSYQAGAATALSHGKTYSVFGQARYNILPNVELAAGVRYTKEIKRTTQEMAFLNSNYIGILSDPSRILNSRVSNDNFSPEATLTWHPTSDQTLYAAYKTGYKSGGISVPSVISAANTAQNLEFKPEKVRGGEIGYKARMFDHRLQFSLTAYYYKFKGLQLASYDAPTASYTIQNAASAKQRGIEGDLNFQLTHEFSLRGSFGYNRLTYGRFIDAACYAYEPAPACVNNVQNLSGRQLHRAPKFSGSAGFSYDTAVSDAFKIGVSSDVLYTSSYNADELQNPAAIQKRYALINATVRLYTPDEKYELALIGRNLSSRRLIGFVQDRPGGGPGQVTEYGTRPREIALQGTFRF